MPLYRSRQEAGARLAVELGAYYKKEDVVVVGLARGGIDTAYAVADHLHVPLDVLVIRKIGAPGNPELAIGAVDEYGTATWNNPFIQSHSISSSYLEDVSKQEAQLARERSNTYRMGMPPLALKNKKVILVDDGVATGFTIQAAIQCIRKLNPEKIIVATPVGSRESFDRLKRFADEVVYLYTPRLFIAVANFYKDFPQLTNEQVLYLLHTAQTLKGTLSRPF